MSDNNNFTIRDNSSEFAKLLDSNWIEALTIIARVQNYNSIDELILELIKDRLEMYSDTRDNLDEDFQKYMHNTIKGKDVPNEWASKQEDNASKFVKDVYDSSYEMKKSDDKEKESLK
jgi:hypothetical protein